MPITVVPTPPPERPDTRALGFTDTHLTFHCVDFDGNRLAPIPVTVTAEDKRREQEWTDWVRECWYAGIIDRPLPAPPAWYRPMKRITGIRVSSS